MATLWIGRSDSRCGACNKNADPYENAHVMTTMRGEGCGVVYTSVASSYFGMKARITEMRPDLPWLCFDFDDPLPAPVLVAAPDEEDEHE